MKSTLDHPDQNHHQQQQQTLRIFDPLKVGAFLANRIFLENPNVDLCLSAFQSEWDCAMPESLHTNELFSSALKGVGIVYDSKGNPSEKRLKYFPVQELSKDRKERFRLIFKAKPKWTLAELEPYVGPLLKPGEKKPDLLKRFHEEFQRGKRD